MRAARSGRWAVAAMVVVLGGCGPAGGGSAQPHPTYVDPASHPMPTLGNGQPALRCTGQYLEQLSLTAHGRIYEVARSQEPHSYRDQLVAYADFLTGV